MWHFSDDLVATGCAGRNLTRPATRSEARFTFATSASYSGGRCRGETDDGFALQCARKIERMGGLAEDGRRQHELHTPVLHTCGEQTVL